MSDTTRPGARKPNHLAGETSPYLLQHLYNPVDWNPWGSEALSRARSEDRPIFLSIGYAACHWCHVMERESFEDLKIAAFLNRHFVPIKVDREERPDIDEIYMNAAQMMTGQGGWPLNVFLTPKLEPFMAGTYFPPEDRHGRIGFPSLLERIHQVWGERRDEIDASAKQMTERLQQIADGSVAAGSGARIGQPEISRAASELAARFDSRWGGFGVAPKFPPDGSLALLLQLHARSGDELPLRMAECTLDSMAAGGMYDHVGGGFARYSVDERWLVPHFEKMLYNQALLVPVYLDAWRITGKPSYRRVVASTLDFVRREMTSGDGGIYSSLDADSEGREGTFYVWTLDELSEMLGGEQASLFAEIYGLTPGGNFEGKNIPNLLQGSLASRAAAMEISEDELVERLEPSRLALLAARRTRVRPATDDKVLTAWNGLMITAYARAFQALGRTDDLTAARNAADFVMSRLMEGDRLKVTYRVGQGKLNGYLDDYAFFGRALLDLYEACFCGRYLEASAALTRSLLRHFEDGERGGFFFTSDDHESLLTRNRSSHDGALPSGAGVAVELLLRLASHLDEPLFRKSADRAMQTYHASVSRMPSAFVSLLLAAELADHPGPEIAILGPPDDPATRSLLDVVRRRYRLRPIVQLAEGLGPTDLPLLAGKKKLGGKPTAYVCRDYACAAPTNDPAELARQLGDLD